MAISVGGLASGLDTENIISQLLAVESRPITKLQTREAAYQVKLTTYGNLQGSLANLKTALGKLDTAGDFDLLSATSSDTDIFTVSADNNATAGTHNITVHSLAQNHKLTSSGFAKNESVGKGTLAIQAGAGTEITVDVASDDTIHDVAKAINAEKGDVTASVIFDGNEYFLTLSADQNGEKNTIRIYADDTGDGSDTDTNGLSRLAYEKGVTENDTLTESQEAMDAMIEMDGVIGIKRASNTMDDVIDGVTINLLKTSENPETDATALVISRDTDTLMTAVGSFVSAYNDVVDFLSTNMAYNPETQEAGQLLGDSTARLIQRRLSTLVHSDYSGTGDIGSLSDLGITKNDEGKLELSESTLSANLENNYDAVVNFFTSTTTGDEGFGVRMVGQLNTFLDRDDGTIAIRQKGIQNSIDHIEEDVERLQAKILESEARMRAQFTALETLLSSYQTTGNYLAQQLEGLQNLNDSIANR